MRRFILASSNPGKLGEFQKLLPLDFFDMNPIRKITKEIVESGNTYFENALIKAMRYFEAFETPVLSDDSGLEIDVLHFKPGVHTADFGKGLSPTQKFRLLYDRLSAYPKEQWVAQFVCVLCYFDGKLPVFFKGVCRGLIAPEARGNNGFGYDPIFLIPDLGKTLAEVDDVTKNRLSHRALATQMFQKWFDQPTN